MEIFDERPAICLITKGEMTAENFAAKSAETLRTIEKAVAAGVSLIQLREKRLPAGRLFDLATAAARITGNSATRLLVNDRADIALAAGANGVQLPVEGLPAEVVRANFPAGFIIGRSAHSLAEIENAKLAGADFALFGPVFATPSKAAYGAPQGISKLRAAARAFPGFPLIALGGIDAGNFGDALSSGARGVAAIRFLNDAQNLDGIVKAIRNGTYE